MKQYKILILFIGLFSLSNSYAQIGGLINKAKEKAAQVKSNLPQGNTKSTEQNTAANKNTAAENTDTAKPGKIMEVKAEARFEFAGENGYTSGSGHYALVDLPNEGPIWPYTHIRKKGEKGNFHFARDYAELKDIATPENKNVTIEFSSFPYKNGDGKPGTDFNSSGGHIYARLKVKEGTIRDAFKLSSNDVAMFVDYFVYPENSEDIMPWKRNTRLFLQSTHIDKQVLDFDIMPNPADMTVYLKPTDRHSYYISLFPFIHNQQFFPKSGKYKIGIRIVADAKDEWGNVTGKFIEAMGSFDYTITVSDSKRIYDEGQVVQKMLKDGIKFAPKPMPKEWGMASAASVVKGYDIATYKQEYSGFYRNIKIIKAVLLPAKGPTWAVVKDNSNILPVYKYCTQTVYFFVKDAQGRCYYHPCDLRQDYMGGGSYGNTHLAVFGEERVYVNCEEMK